MKKLHSAKHKSYIACQHPDTLEFELTDRRSGTKYVWTLCKKCLASLNLEEQEGR